MNKTKKCLCFGVIACVLVLALCWAFRGQECEVTIERRPPEDEAMPEGCTVELGQDEILIRDYWRSIDSYTTAYASARLRGDKLVVHSRRSCAADEIYMTGSDVLLRVKLPKGIKGTELKKIIVRSKGETWRETTRVSFP